MKKGPGVLAVYFEMLAIMPDRLRKLADSVRPIRSKILNMYRVG